MLGQLKELLEMQKALDETLMKEHGLKEYPFQRTKIALLTEIGEMMNEIQTEFKWWKKHATYNREKALEEYVDCLHFALSLSNYWEVIDDIEFEQYAYSENNSLAIGYMTLDYVLIRCVEGDETCLLYLFDIGNYLGFSWEEIYSAYKKKNAVNYERLRNGY